jgi:hypothetical protein
MLESEKRVCYTWLPHCVGKGKNNHAEEIDVNCIYGVSIELLNVESK